MNRWVPHTLEGRYAIRDTRSDQLLRGWRTGHKKLIWRGTLDECKALCAQLNKGEINAPREEQAKSQQIHYMNRARIKRNTSVPVQTFRHCADCDSMVKNGHTCEKGK